MAENDDLICQKACEQLLRAAGPAMQARVARAVDCAVASAQQKGGLREAAAWLEEARAAMVVANVFRNWDDGIGCFATVIRHTRKISGDTGLPKEFRRLFDAIPQGEIALTSARQKKFWYGASRAPIARRSHPGLIRQLPIVVWLPVLLSLAAGVLLALAN